MLWTWALRKMPWKTLLVHAPTLVDAARHLYATTRPPARDGAAGTRTGDGLEPLRRAVEELEEQATRQAALVADLAKQVETLTTAVDVLRARVVVALTVASVTLGAALVTAVVLAWR